MIHVCLSFTTALAVCDEEGPQVNYTGYEVALFRRLADRMVWVFNDTDFVASKWEFSCVDWDTATLDLYKTADDPTRFCDISFGAIDATSERLLNGAQFSTPTYAASLQLLMLDPETRVDRWAFLAPFKAELWVALFGTSAAVAVSVWLQELPWGKVVSHPLQALKKLSNLQWASMALLVQILAEFSARRTGARITILGYGFLVLIALNTYMAVLAARLTVNTIQQGVSGLDELASRAVGVFETDAEDVQMRTPLLDVVPLRWDSLEDEQEMLRKLRAGEVAALLLDSPWVQYQAATHCDFTIANDKIQILPFNIAFGFPVDFPHDKLVNVNMALAQLMEEGIFNALQNQYIKPSAVCPSKSAQADLASIQLGFSQLSGLWIFLGAAMGLGWLLDLGNAAWRCCRHSRRNRLRRSVTPLHDDSDAPAAAAAAAAAADAGGPSGRHSDGVIVARVAGRHDVEAGAGSGSKVHAGKAPCVVVKTSSVASVVSMAREASVRVGAGGGASGGGGVAASARSASSLQAMSSRLYEQSRSFFQLPEVADSWMAVGDASTVDEMVELLEMQVRHLDSRLRKALPALERRIERSQQAVLAALEETLAAANRAAAARACGAGGGGSRCGGGGGGGAGRGGSCGVDRGVPANGSVTGDDIFGESTKQLLQVVADGGSRQAARVFGADSTQDSSGGGARSGIQLIRISGALDDAHAATTVDDDRASPDSRATVHALSEPGNERRGLDGSNAAPAISPSPRGGRVSASGTGDVAGPYTAEACNATVARGRTSGSLNGAGTAVPAVDSAALPTPYVRSRLSGTGRRMHMQPAPGGGGGGGSPSRASRLSASSVTDASADEANLLPGSASRVYRRGLAGVTGNAAAVVAADGRTPPPGPGAGQASTTVGMRPVRSPLGRAATHTGAANTGNEWV